MNVYFGEWNCHAAIILKDVNNFIGQSIFSSERFIIRYFLSFVLNAKLTQSNTNSLLDVPNTFTFGDKQCFLKFFTSCTNARNWVKREGSELNVKMPQHLRRS